MGERTKNLTSSGFLKYFRISFVYFVTHTKYGAYDLQGQWTLQCQRTYRARGLTQGPEDIYKEKWNYIAIFLNICLQLSREILLVKYPVDFYETKYRPSCIWLLCENNRNLQWNTSYSSTKNMFSISHITPCAILKFHQPKYCIVF